MTRTEAAIRLSAYIIFLSLMITLPTLIFGVPKQETKKDVVKHDIEECYSVYHCTKTTL